MAGEIIDVNIYTTLDKLHVITRNVYIPKVGFRQGLFCLSNQ